MAVFIAMGSLAKWNHLKRYDAHLYCHSQPLTCCCLRWDQLSPLDSFIDWSSQPSHWQHRLDKREPLNSAFWVWRAGSSWFDWVSCWWRKAFYSIFIPSNWLIGWHLTVRWCVRSHLPPRLWLFLVFCHDWSKLVQRPPHRLKIPRAIDTIDRCLWGTVTKQLADGPLVDALSA